MGIIPLKAATAIICRRRFLGTALGTKLVETRPSVRMSLVEKINALYLA